MTKEEALNDYEMAGRMIEELQYKRTNLKKIIFSEVGVPQSIIPKSDRMPGNVRAKYTPKGKTAERVVSIMSEHDSPLTAREIATLGEFTDNQVHGVLYKLKSQHLVNGYKIDSSNPSSPVKWSLTVHRDKSELNHV